MEKRKTIGGEDILYAMVTLGFEQYAETLKIHLAKLRQVGRHTLLCSQVRVLLFSQHQSTSGGSSRQEAAADKQDEQTPAEE